MRLLALVLMLTGCAKSHKGEETASSGLDETHTTGSPSTMDPLPTASVSSGGDGPSSATAAVSSSSGGEQIQECDMWLQDCPDGMKCMPFTSEASLYLGATHCIPVPARPAQYEEPCTRTGTKDTPSDNCARGLVCWAGDGDQGHCVSLCGGSHSQPICPANHGCATLNQAGTLNICHRRCDPLAPSCLPGSTCYLFNETSEELFCVDALDPMQLDYGGPCVADPQCGPGLLCVAHVHVPGCQSSTCCTAFCELSGGADVCPDAPQQTCRALGEWWPPQFGHVGFCSAE